jgi:uncharacterized protein (TIGR03067 family)
MTPILILALAVAAPAAKEPPKKDEPTLVGVWAAESGIKNGRPDTNPTDATLEFTADGKVTLKEKGRDITGTYTSDPKKDPPELDLTLSAGGMSIAMPGIFKIEKDTLTICLVPTGDRPKRFESVEGSMNMLLTLKRTKPEKK